MICIAANCDNLLSGRQVKFCSDNCRNKTNVSRWRINTKAKLVEYFGGSCQRCGYNKSMAALHFHHMGNDKLFGIATKGRTRSWEKLLAEASKCELICANCHAELHHSGVV